MITLKDYLGTIVAGINQARAMADFESAAIARRYAEDDILKRFSVPRMTMDDVEITVPVAVDALDTQSPKDYQPINNKEFASLAYQVIKDQYQVSSFDRKTSEFLRKKIYEATDLIEKEIKAGKGTSEALNRFVLKLSKDSKELIAKRNDLSLKKKAIKKDKLTIVQPEESAISSALNSRLRKNITPLSMQSNIENARVTVEAEKLKSMKPESLLFIKMKISERGMIWETMENQLGEIESRLLPE